MIAGLLAGGIYQTVGSVRAGYIRTNRLTGAMTWCVAGSCQPVALDRKSAPTRVAPTPPLIDFLPELPDQK